MTVEEKKKEEQNCKWQQATSVLRIVAVLRPFPQWFLCDKFYQLEYFSALTWIYIVNDAFSKKKKKLNTLQ